MKKFSLFILVVFMAAVFIDPAPAQVKKVAQTGLQFLKIDVSPRSSAMGGAFSLVGNDASAMFSNPAGIAMTNSNVDVFLGRIEWIAEISYNAAAVMKDFGSWGQVGVSFMNADYGEIIGTRVAANEAGFIETGDVNVEAYVMGLTYARSLTNKFSIGAQVKYAYQHLGDNLFSNGKTIINEESGLAYDFGTIFYPGFKSFRFGMSIRNFSTDFKYQEDTFQLPLTFRLGVAMDVLDFMGEHSDPLIVSIDAIHPRDYTERLNMGAEYLYMNMFAFRAGYRFNYDEESFTTGLGFKLDIGGGKLNLDYSYNDFGVFDSVSRFALGFSF